MEIVQIFIEAWILPTEQTDGIVQNKIKQIKCVEIERERKTKKKWKTHKNGCDTLSINTGTEKEKYYCRRWNEKHIIEFITKCVAYIDDILCKRYQNQLKSNNE